VRFVPVAFVAALIVPAWSFAHAVMVSNGDPFSANATEWARSHSLGGLVDGVERLWYSHHQPPKGGAPAGGIARANRSSCARGTMSSRPCLVGFAVPHPALIPHVCPERRQCKDVPTLRSPMPEAEVVDGVPPIPISATSWRRPWDVRGPTQPTGAVTGVVAFCGFTCA
jgi:hypothetical protein